MLNIDGISDRIKKTGFVIEVDSEIVQLAQGARAEYLNAMSSLQVHARRESFSPKDLERGPWRKLAIGSANGVGDPYAQMLQTTYFHEHNAGTPFLNALFATLISVRNRILGTCEDFGSYPDRDEFWNACRIHHYPRGGGFMVEHNDTHFPNVLASAGVSFLQVWPFFPRRKSIFTLAGASSSTEMEFEHT